MLRSLNFSIVSENINLFVADRTPDEIAWVQLETHGDDWLWIDQVEVIATGASEVEVWQWGGDNTQGYCFSTDPSDGNNTNCEPDGSTRSRICTSTGRNRSSPGP